MKQAKLEALFEYLPKSKIKAGDGLDGGIYPFYTSSENQTRYLDEYQHEPGCLVFGTGGKASVHLATSRFATSTDCIVIRPKARYKVDATYVFQYFKGNMHVLENGFKGAGLKHISKGYLSEIQIPYPEDLNDQIRIARLLGKVEGLIAQRKQHLQQLDDLLKSVFLGMFGDPVRNERGWEKKPFSTLLLDIQSGKSPKCEARSAIIDEWGVLKLGAVTSCFFKEEENKALPENERPSIRDEVKAGDLLFSRKNTYELVAACAYVFSTRSKLLMPDLIFRFVFRDDAEVNPIYMWKLLNAQSQRKAIQSLASGAAGSMPNISKANLREVLLPIPPLALQNDFAAIVKKVEDLKSRYQQSLTDLEALYGTLSQRAFKGELDLSRVPLLTRQPEGEQTMAIEPLPPHTAEIAINLPNTEFVLTALENPEQRPALLHQWLEAYRGQLGDTPFSLERFMAAAQTRLSELHPGTDFELGPDDYEHIKTWVFDALATGKLMQAFEDDENLIKLRKRSDQWGSW